MYLVGEPKYMVVMVVMVVGRRPWLLQTRKAEARARRPRGIRAEVRVHTTDLVGLVRAVTGGDADDGGMESRPTFAPRGWGSDGVSRVSSLNRHK